MNARDHKAFAAAALAMGLTASGVAVESAESSVKAAPQLHTDPFTRPIAAIPEPLVEEIDTPDSGFAGVLRIVVRAGKDSMVNVDGKIVPLGGSYKGFRLISVSERGAIFEKDGKQLELSLDSAEHEAIADAH